jgi:cell division protein FtsQ
MRRVAVIFKWILPIIMLISLLIFTNERQLVQQVCLKKIAIQESAHKFVDEQIVLNYLEDKSICFDSVLITDFKTEELESILESHSAIKEAEVFVSQKGNVEVMIQQKKPIIRVKSYNGDYYLDEFGKIMQLSDNFTPKLLVATGDISINNHSGIHKFITEINGSIFWRSQITQIHFENNNILLIPRVGGQIINIGNFEKISEKLQNLYQFYKVAMPVMGWETYSDINLKFENQIVCVKNYK